MSNKLKYIVFFGAVFGLLGFAHSVRCSETPILSNLVGWLTICTALYYFTAEFMVPHLGRYAVITAGAILENEARNVMIAALIFSALQHIFIYIDMYMTESVAAALFCVWFYMALGKAVDG